MLSTAQRKAREEFLKQNSFMFASKNLVLLSRDSIDYLLFDVPAGIETITKIQLFRSNTVTTELCDTPAKIVLLLSERTNTSKEYTYAEFHVASILDPVTITGEPFPVFMFGNYQFRIAVYPTIETFITNDVIRDFDMWVETIIRKPSIRKEKEKTMQEIKNNPWKHTITSPNLLKTINDVHEDYCSCDGSNSYMDILNNCAESPLENSSSNSFSFENISGIISHEKRSLLFPGDTIKTKKIKLDNAPIQKKQVTLDLTIESLSDLIAFLQQAKTFDCANNDYSINIEQLLAIEPILMKLNSVIGMNALKNTLSEWIMFFLSGLPMGTDSQFFNMALIGPPGVGKSYISGIIAELMASLGLTKKKEYVKINASELIAKYVGNSEAQTTEILQKNKGSVIVIDEAYSIARSSDGKFCSFGVKVLDVINKFLGENPDTIMIICGYKDLLTDYFFGANVGLKRRFPWEFTIDGYTNQELYNILLHKISQTNYTIPQHNSNEIISLLERHRNELTGNAGDIINILSRVISIHCRNILRIPGNQKFTISHETIVTAIKEYTTTMKKEPSSVPFGMYN